MIDPVTIIVTGVALWSAITATITAFKDGGKLLREWQKKRAAKKIRTNQYDELDRALINGPADVQGEYNRLLGLIGPHFAQGDSM